MFESILIRRHLDGPKSVDAGIIAETLLFYEHVHIVADESLLSDLVRVIGPYNLLKMLDLNIISLTYIRETLVVLTNTLPSGMQFHNFGAAEIGGKTNKRLHNADFIERVAERTLGKSRDTKRFTKQLLDKIIFRSLGSSESLPQGFPALVREDLHDAAFVKKAVEHTIRTLMPTVVLPDVWTFEVAFATDDSFIVGTTLDFAKLNIQYHNIFLPEHSSLTPAFLLSFLCNARADAYLAADYMTEIVTTPVASGIINAKFHELLAKRERSSAQIEMFQNQFLDDARAVREAVNSGERSFEELLVILEKAQKFKQWLGTRNPDTELLREYYKSVTKDTWVDRLPSKSLRFVLTTVAGIGADMLLPTGGVGTGVGIGVGAIDAFLVDRFLKGWRPNQFIEGELRKFTSGKA
jgi:hypothetical protein